MKTKVIILGFVFVFILIVVNIFMHIGGDFKIFKDYDAEVRNLKKSQLRLLEELNKNQISENDLSERMGKISRDWLEVKPNALDVNEILENMAEEFDMSLNFTSQLKFKDFEQGISLGELKFSTDGTPEQYMPFLNKLTARTPRFYISTIDIKKYKNFREGEFSLVIKLKLLSINKESL